MNPGTCKKLLGPAKVIGLSRMSRQAKCIFFCVERIIDLISDREAFYGKQSLKRTYISRNTNVRFFSLGLVDDIDAINEDILKTSSEIWNGREVRQVWLNYSSDIHLNGNYVDV